MGLKLNAANGGGSVELDVPSTVNSDLALTVPAAAGELVVKDSLGKVGIGTSSPQRDLHIHNASSSTNAYLQLTSATTGTSSTDGFQLWAYGSGGNTNAVIAQRENAALEIWTNNTERMRIHSDGEVTKSAQPGVAAHDDRGWVIFNNGNVFDFNTTQYNVGNHYSTSNGRFTAPVAGNYLINTNIYFDTASGNYNTPFYLELNGSQYAPTGSASPWSQHVVGAGSGDQTNGWSYVVNLSVNDYIEIRFASQCRVYTKHSYINIHLLH